LWRAKLLCLPKTLSHWSHANSEKLSSSAGHLGVSAAGVLLRSARSFSTSIGTQLSSLESFDDESEHSAVRLFSGALSLHSTTVKFTHLSLTDVAKSALLFFGASADTCAELAASGGRAPQCGRVGGGLLVGQQLSTYMHIWQLLTSVMKHTTPYE